MPQHAHIAREPEVRNVGQTGVGFCRTSRWQSKPISGQTYGMNPRPLPLSNIRVIEFSHMVMGPTCGMVLADLGAEVIKVEPITGDNTRHLLGAGAGFFAMFNRNKKSITLNLQSAQGLEVAHKLIATADVVSENFRPGAMQKLGLDYARLSRLNERLVYVSHKGFLPGPYEHRTALDEVVQMMGGLAYMTGRPGDPLRAGSSVNDIMGGMFGAIGVMAALMQPAAPMPTRISAWGIYDVFSVRDDAQIFLAVVSDTQWAVFCDAFGFADFKGDARLRSNNDRVRARDWMMPLLRERLKAFSAAELSARFELHGLPFAPITQPQDLFDDPHLNQTGGLAPMHLPDGRATKVPLLPLALDGQRLGVRLDPPKLGEHSEELLLGLGYHAAQITAMQAAGSVGGPA